MDHIEETGLQELYDLLRRGISRPVLYEPSGIELDKDALEYKDRNLLISEKRKKGRALARLKSLYLYEDEALPEKGSLIERKNLTDGIIHVNARLEEIESGLSAASRTSDDEFFSQASYFRVSTELEGKREIKYEALAAATNPAILKDFINSVIQKFCILDGKIESICFKNGITYRFMYKQNE